MAAVAAADTKMHAADTKKPAASSTSATAATASSSSSSSSSKSGGAPAVASSSSSSSSSAALAKCDPAIEAAVGAGTPLKQGAEARVYVGEWLGRKVIIKERFSKKYRHPTLDAKLTAERLTTEVRCMVKCRSVGVACPAIYYVDAAHTHRIVMEFIEGFTLRDVLEQHIDLSSTSPAVVARVTALGAAVGKAIYGLHSAGVVHGDLTSSNLIVRPDNSVVVIDFGLAFVSQMIEDRAVDLYVLERALLSTHPHSQSFFDAILTEYHSTKKDSTKVIQKLHQVRMRGRKRSMVG